MRFIDKFAEGVVKTLCDDPLLYPFFAYFFPIFSAVWIILQVVGAYSIEAVSLAVFVLMILNGLLLIGAKRRRKRRINHT